MQKQQSNTIACDVIIGKKVPLKPETGIKEDY